jgi:ATP-dependent RNA helicase DDX31/DBP7
MLRATPDWLLLLLLLLLSQNTASFRTERLSWLVLDEADRLLDLGFEAKLKAIIEALAARAAAAADNTYAPAAHEGRLQCQTVLLSATLHPGLAGLASLSMRDPVGVGFDAKLVDGQLQLQEIPTPGDATSGHKQAGKAAAAGQGQFELPQQLQQRYVEVPAKARLVALIGGLSFASCRGCSRGSNSAMWAMGRRIYLCCPVVAGVCVA